MKSYSLLKDIIDLVEEFEKETHEESEITIGNFSNFLNARSLISIQDQSSVDLRFGAEELFAQEMAYQLDNNIGRLFVYMSRYAKNYIKKALDGSALHTAEDFTSLAILLTHESLSKTELIGLNLQEKTSGTEVINRLIKAGLVIQQDDKKDKRSKKISITEKGKELLYVVFNDMNHVGKMVTGNLSDNEKLTLQYLLQKLENFHYDIHKNKTISNKNELIAYSY
ncbi:MarR family winged helix-turn-helix transcriptional regulator [Pedobacter fastidiosus]|uniref:Winged helix-turn-helix transcriptional regulator n=1 Tax=Pedobacter fastidiosus TaxID=2765361 RepID=A0ABR7KY14_9SPHI|nr:MarR family winged helix-turn-helix transcriptional regulator [Pedobacter fastidiosus]MBC6112967.1 winged helix-turn-helix transcriptional regulator [Pedobacter fastidiosus]